MDIGKCLLGLDGEVDLDFRINQGGGFFCVCRMAYFRYTDGIGTGTVEECDIRFTPFPQRVDTYDQFGMTLFEVADKNSGHVAGDCFLLRGNPVFEVDDHVIGT